MHKHFYYSIFFLTLIITSCGSKKSDPTPPSIPTISGFTISKKQIGDADFTITPPISNSTGAFTYSSSNNAVAQVTGNKISVKGVGLATITATQAASSNYSVGTTAALFEVSGKAPTLGSFPAPVFIEGSKYLLTPPTSNSPAKFFFTSNDRTIAKISGDTLIVIGKGETTITATQNTSGDYATAEATLALTSTLAPITSPIKDADNNVYTSVAIGKQVWLVQNLATTKYRDGSAIPKMTDDSNTGWGALTTGAYTTFYGDPSYKALYGCLYNWYVTNDTRHIAPAGWHVSEKEEWNQLITVAGGPSNAGNTLRYGVTPWSIGAGADITRINNSTGFTAMPGGFFTYDGPTDKFAFFNSAVQAVFWEAEQSNTANGTYVSINSSSVITIQDIRKQSAFSVRCVQDYAVTFK